MGGWTSPNCGHNVILYGLASAFTNFPVSLNTKPLLSMRKGDISLCLLIVWWLVDSPAIPCRSIFLVYSSLVWQEREACMHAWSITKGFNWLVSLPPHIYGLIFFGLAGKRDMYATVLVQWNLNCNIWISTGCGIVGASYQFVICRPYPFPTYLVIISHTSRKGRNL